MLDLIMKTSVWCSEAQSKRLRRPRREFLAADSDPFEQVVGVRKMGCEEEVGNSCGAIDDRRGAFLFRVQ